MRYRTATLLERIRQDVAAERNALMAADQAGPSAIHLRRAVNRMQVTLAELDAVARHLRRAAEAERSEASRYVSAL